MWTAIRDILCTFFVGEELFSLSNTHTILFLHFSVLSLT